MAALIGALRATLSADTANFEAGMKRAQRQAASSSTAISKSFGAVKAGIAGLASGLSVGLLANVARGALDYAGSLGEVAQQLGVTTRELQTFRFAAQQAGASQEEADSALGKLAINLSKAASGSKKAQTTFQALGISLEDIRTKSKSEIIGKIADQMNRTGGASANAAAGVAIFGKGFQKIVPLLSEGSAGINQLALAAEKMGIVLSDAQIQKADETADKMDALKTVLSAKIAGSVAENSDAILGFVDDLLKLVAALGRAADAWTRYKARVAIEVLELGRLNPFADQAALARRIAEERQNAGLGSSSISGLRLSPPKPVAPRSSTGTPTQLESGGSGQRSDRDAYNAFLRELRRLKIEPTSGIRSTAKQAELYRRLGPGNAARPGTSDHEFYRAFDFSTSVDPEKIALAAARAGVSLGQPLVHGGKGNLHRHQPFSDGRGSGGGEADLAEQIEAAQRARLQSIDAAHAFAQEQRRADADILSAQRDLAVDYVERTALSKQILDLNREEQRAELAHQVETYKLTNGAQGLSQAQAAQIAAQQDILHNLEVQKLLQEEQAERAREFAALEQVDFDLERQRLEGEVSLAETASECRAAELRLLELIYRQERARLEAVLADEQSTWAAKEEARRRLAALPGEQATATQGVLQSTRGPMEDYLATLPSTAAKAQEALERLQVQGLEGLLDSALALSEGLGAAKDSLLNTLKQFLLGLARMELQKGLASILGNGGLVANLGKGIPGFATGGGFNILGNHGTDRNLLSLNNLPIARVSHGERLTIGNDNEPAGRGRVIINQHISTPDANSFNRSRSQIARQTRRGLGI